MARVVVVGSLNVDTRVLVDHIPAPGETVTSERTRQIGLGGKGTNQAVAAARLGADVLLIAPVGADARGEWARDQLHAEPLVVHLETQSEAPTGEALIIVDRSGENAVIVESGANAIFDFDADLGSMLAEADVLLLQLELPVATVVRFARTAKAAGTLVVTNCAPVPAAFTPELTGLLNATDVLIVNEIEAHQLAGPVRDAAVDGWRRLGELGPATVVVTRGSQGIVAYTDAEAVEIPPISAQAVDTTGAGDACAAGIAVGLSEGMGLREALELGNAGGAVAVGRAGTVASFGDRDEIDALLVQAGRGRNR